jgi:hypothetical protein
MNPFLVVSLTLHSCFFNIALNVLPVPLLSNFLPHIVGMALFPKVVFFFSTS